MRRTMLTMGVLVAFLCSLFISAPASATGFLTVPGPPPRDRIVIDVVTVNGSGCPAGTAAVAVAEDNTTFTVTYSQYTAHVGVGSAPTDMRKNCQLSLVVHVPAGFTYAIAKADYRGFASIARGATAVQRASYYFQGSSQTAWRAHNFGPMVDNWQATDVTDLAALIWHPCGALRNFNINTELRVNVGTSDPRRTTSFIAMDSTDASIDTLYHFHWGRC
jgi:hypothetical protein